LPDEGKATLTIATKALLAVGLLAVGLLAAGLLVLGGCGLIGSAINTAASLAVPAAGAKVTFACIPEGTTVDTRSGPIPIEALRAGDVVRGYDGAPVRVLQVHAYAEDPATEFLAIEFEGGARVDLCGMHRIGGVRAKDLCPGNEIAGRTVERVSRYVGVERSYDLLTEDAGYRVQGLPVNSMIDEMNAAGRTGRIPAE
jgi:hypothetical protein